jgi:hypothetical protein
MKTAKHPLSPLRRLLRAAPAAALVVSTLFLAPMPAGAADVNIMLGAIQGDVRIQESGATKPALPYSFLNPGDAVLVGKTGKAQIMYLESATEELWPSGSRLRIGNGKSEALSGNPERLATLPPILLRQLKKTPGGEATSRVGMVRLRNLSETRRQEILDNYASLRAQMPQGSYLAEVYTLNALIHEQDLNYAAQFLNQLIQSAPQSEGLRQLAEKYRSTLEPPLPYEPTAAGRPSPSP